MLAPGDGQMVSLYLLSALCLTLLRTIDKVAKKKNVKKGSLV